MIHFLRFTLITAVTVLAAACSNLPEIQSVTEKEADFGAYKSFNFLPAAAADEKKEKK